MTIWSPLNTEPWCTVFCRLFDMAPHLGTFLILIKVSEKFKKMCLPWPRRWAGPCYRMPRYYVHETIRLSFVLIFFYQIWFQFWYAVSLVLTLGYGYSEHKVKRNYIPVAMLVIGVASYVVCWCGMFGRKQDGSHAAAGRTDRGDKAKNHDENENNNVRAIINNNNNLDGGDDGCTDPNQTIPMRATRNNLISTAATTTTTTTASSINWEAAIPAPHCISSMPNLPLTTGEFSDDE